MAAEQTGEARWKAMKEGLDLLFAYSDETASTN